MIAHASHLRLLVKTALRTRGPILELGAGWYSTPILHEIASAHDRLLITVENDPSWLDRFRHLVTRRHRIELVADWDDFVPDPEGYGMALIDHAPAARRAVDIERLAPLVDLFVIHDTESPEYRYDTIWPMLDRIETDQTVGPWTTVAAGRLQP